MLWLPLLQPPSITQLLAVGWFLQHDKPSFNMTNVVFGKKIRRSSNKVLLRAESVTRSWTTGNRRHCRSPRALHLRHTHYSGSYRGFCRYLRHLYSNPRNCCGCPRCSRRVITQRFAVQSPAKILSQRQASYPCYQPSIHQVSSHQSYRKGSMPWPLS